MKQLETLPPRSTIRSSNLELFRIIVMLSIVAHHYVVNSGLTAADGPFVANPLSVNTLFLRLFGMWGKVGINCFVLITGYFMCKSKITLKKFLKLILEIEFYNIVFYAAFLLTGYQSFGIMSFFKAVLPITGITDGFISCYLVFYLFIPFLNILIQNMTEKQHILMTSLCCFVYVIIGTTILPVKMNYVSWFIVLYFIASYIRLYPKKWFDDTKITGIATVILVLISMCSVIVMQFLFRQPYYFVADSNKILAVLTAVAAFCFFKNLKIKNNKFINAVAASTFGVLLIHANSDAMRQWLWKDTLNNVGMYQSSFLYLHAFASVIIVFVICTVLDMLRRKLLEEPLFKWLDKKI